MKTVFIINPRTDRKKQYRLMKEIKMHFAGQRIIIEKTIRPGFATFIARKYAFQAQKEPIHIYVCGGDGTLHEVINGVANTPNVYVSIIPIGTGNDFIKSFDALSIDDFLHLENYKDPIPMDIDLLKVNGEYAINTISFGFDVQVAKYANHMKTKLPLKGIVPYYMGMLATLLHNSVQEYRLQIDDQRLSLQEYMFVVFCNGRFYGGGYQPCPDALLNDGWIDVCLIKPVPKKMIIDMAKTYEQGKHIEYPEYVSLYQAKTIGMNTENQSIYGNLDGEVRKLRNPTIEVVEQALHLYLPNIE